MIGGTAEQIGSNWLRTLPFNGAGTCPHTHVCYVIVQHHNAYLGTVNAQMMEINKTIAEQAPTTRPRMMALARLFPQGHVTQQTALRTTMHTHQQAENARLRTQYNEILTKSAELKRTTEEKNRALEAQIAAIEAQNRELERLFTELTSLKNELQERI